MLQSFACVASPLRAGSCTMLERSSQSWSIEDLAAWLVIRSTGARAYFQALFVAVTDVNPPLLL